MIEVTIDPTLPEYKAMAEIVQAWANAPEQRARFDKMCRDEIRAEINKMIYGEAYRLEPDKVEG